MKRKQQEEEAKKKQEAEEEKLRAERELEEAKLQAKRDRERKAMIEEESGDLLSLNSFGSFAGGGFDLNLSGKEVKDIRSSLKMSSNAAENTHK